MKENFAFEKVAEDWVNFFDDLENNRFEPLSYIDRNDNLSRLREKIVVLKLHFLVVICFLRLIYTAAF